MAAQSATDISILIVDDCADTRMLLRQLLKQLGHSRITEEGSGAGALKVLERQKFDLVVCDWQMPEVSGIDVLKKLRETGRTKDIPFLMVTSNGRKEQVVEAIEAGVSDYIVKPFTTQILTDKIRAVTRNPASSRAPK